MVTTNRRWRLLYTEADTIRMPDDLMDRAAAVGIEIETTSGYSRAELLEQGQDCDGVFLLHADIDEEMMAEWPNCRVLARAGTGYELIDVEAAQRRGIVVTYVPDFCSPEMSDSVILFILALNRRLPTFFDAARNHQWLSPHEFPTPHRLAGQTLGILGFGHSGQLTARKARALGLDVRVWTRTPRPSKYEEIGVEPVPFEEALDSDYVSLHLPLTEETRHLIDAEALSQFKVGGYLINVARGGIVDTDALTAAVEMGSLSGAALDVVEPYPFPAGHPLWDLPQVIITPHIAGFSSEALAKSFRIALEDAALVLRGFRPRHPVPEHWEWVQGLPAKDASSNTQKKNGSHSHLEEGTNRVDDPQIVVDEE